MRLTRRFFSAFISAPEIDIILQARYVAQVSDTSKADAKLLEAGKELEGVNREKDRLQVSAAAICFLQFAPIKLLSCICFFWCSVVCECIK